MKKTLTIILASGLLIYGCEKPKSAKDFSNEMRIGLEQGIAIDKVIESKKDQYFTYCEVKTGHLMVLSYLDRHSLKQSKGEDEKYNKKLKNPEVRKLESRSSACIKPKRTGFFGSNK